MGKKPRVSRELHHCLCVVYIYRFFDVCAFCDAPPGSNGLAGAILLDPIHLVQGMYTMVNMSGNVGAIKDGAIVFQHHE